MLRTLIFATASAVLLPACAVSQTRAREVSDVHLRNDCRLASQVLRTGHPHPKYDWAVEFASQCEDSGPAAYAVLWESASDTADVYRLLSYSSRLRDQRLVDRAFELARDRGEPDVVRVGAVLLLLKYIEPRQGIAFSQLTPPAEDGAPVRMISGGRSPHATPQIEGSTPIRPGLPQSTLLLLRELTGDPSRPVGYAAARLAKTLETRIVTEQSFRK